MARLIMNLNLCGICHTVLQYYMYGCSGSWNELKVATGFCTNKTYEQKLWIQNAGNMATEETWLENANQLGSTRTMVPNEECVHGNGTF